MAMFTLTLKAWNGSLWNSLNQLFRRQPTAHGVDVDRLSQHLLRDLGLARNEPTDLLAAERTRFLN